MCSEDHVVSTKLKTTGIYHPRSEPRSLLTTMRVELIDHFKPCMTEIYLHIDARMADYIIVTGGQNVDGKSHIFSFLDTTHGR